MFQKTGAELQSRLQLNSQPLGIKLLEKDTLLPEGTVRPLIDYKTHLSLCQGFSLARWQGTHMAMFKEDMWCFFPVIGFGFEEPTDYFLEGHTRYPGAVANLEAGALWSREFPRLQYGKYSGLMFAPLKTINFTPDIILFYCDSVRLTHVVKAISWKDGRDVEIEPRLCGSAACVYSIVQPLLNSKYKLTLPCWGDRRRALARDDELIFSFQSEKILEIVEGLKNIKPFDEQRFPTPLTCCPEHDLDQSYIACGKTLKMKLE